jgi:DNA-directed RNA polymerases I, II, and III subunit RPABC2
LFLVLKDSSNKKSSTKKETTKKKQKPSPRSAVQKSKKVSTSGTKRDAGKSKKRTTKVLVKTVESEIKGGGRGNSIQELSLSTRPQDEVVTYDEIDFQLQEISGPSTEVLIGPQSLTRFEKARITGARSLQLSLGAPSLIAVPDGIKDSISLAVAELEVRALPISIRRILPNGLYQDIPIDLLR